MSEDAVPSMSSKSGQEDSVPRQTSSSVDPKTKQGKETPVMSQPSAESLHVESVPSLSTPERKEKIKGIAVFTSGGDSQGMNAALRAIVRVGIFNHYKVFAVYEGYQGLVEGADKMKEMSWLSVSNIIQFGGTIIGTARCQEFRERPGRLKAAKNLIKNEINSLAVIGGDGSLTGANLFKQEWKGLVKELLEKGEVTQEEAAECSYLNIVGLVGSIDNDMCGTDMTIGTDTCLHRILEAADCLTSTAASHQRSFVLEVMGRHCGYLAQMAGIAGGADWVLIPENPPQPGWEKVMCEKIASCRDQGRRHSLVIISEGAVDTKNRRISAEYVKDVLEKELKHNTRITVLGHVQRGGKPSAFDRAIGCRMGAKAALTLINAKGEIDPVMIALQGNRIVEVPLMDCVTRTRAIDKAMTECNFKKALELRGEGYERNRKILKRLESCVSPACCNGRPSPDVRYRFAVMNVGAPAAGMNSCTRAFVRLLLYEGHTVLGIEDGFVGLINDNVREMEWKEVDQWGSSGGSNLGTNRTVPTDENMREIATKLSKYQIQGLLVIGGFEGYHGLVKLEKHRDLYPAFRIPLLGVAATISNNVPGTECSLGCDTALNIIVNAMDTLKLSAHASRKRVFVVETMGGYCGYLATMAAIAGGADAAYIFEEKFTIADLQKDITYMIGKFRDGLQRGVLLRNERCSQNFTTEFLCQLVDEEGKGMFITRKQILGHLQQGDRPSPYDRILGVKYASNAVDFMLDQASKNTKEGSVHVDSKESAAVLGIIGSRFRTTPLQDLAPETDFKYRIPRRQWWMSLRKLISLLAKHKEQFFVGEEYHQAELNRVETNIDSHESLF